MTIIFLDYSEISWESIKDFEISRSLLKTGGSRKQISVKKQKRSNFNLALIMRKMEKKLCNIP